jgi:hypothetical protein
MRSGGNFNPEWGYLAPAPSFMRTARIVVVATAIGATAGAGVVLTLAGSGNNPGQQAADTGKSLVVVRSLVQPAEAATATTEPRVAPVATAAPVATPVVTPQPVQASAQPSQASAHPKGSLALPPPAAQISAPASSESRAASTSAVPASVAALAEIPPVTDASAAPSANQALFTPDQTGAAKLGGKPAAGPISQPTAVQTQGPQAPVAQTPQTAAQAVASAKKKPEEHGLGPMLRHLFSARAGNSYYPN